MDKFSYIGRPDGLGNRIEEIINLEVICSRMDTEGYYIWKNGPVNRAYSVCFLADKVRVIAEDEPVYEVKGRADFEMLAGRDEVINAGRKIVPKFGIRFEGDIRPVGVHIRGGDRIGVRHPHFMENEQELYVYLSGAIDYLNEKKPSHLFVCSDDDMFKETFLRYLDPGIQLVKPICDVGVAAEYEDFFALSLCEEILMASKFSSFAITASLICDVPLVVFHEDDEVTHRYMAAFKYHLDFDRKRVRGPFRMRGILRRFEMRLSRLKKRLGWVASVVPN